MFPTVYAAEALIDPGQAYAISDIIRVAIALIVFFSGMLAVIFIVWGGVMLILSGGKEEKIKPAISSIRFAAIGIIVVVVSLFVVSRVGDLLGLEVSRYISVSEIFATIKDLAVKIVNGNSGGVAQPVFQDTGNIVLPDDFTDL